MLLKTETLNKITQKNLGSILSGKKILHILSAREMLMKPLVCPKYSFYSKVSSIMEWNCTGNYE